MHDLKKRLEDVMYIKDRLISFTKEEIDKGKDCIDTKELGEVVDMIKDLADAEKNCLEACYYMAATEAMEEAEDDYPEGPMGYDRYRYRSGRFAPKGRGHISGFTPTTMQMPYIYDYIHDPEHFRNEMKDGYRSQSGNRMTSRPNGGGYGRYGYTPHPIDMYRDSKRYYHETKDAEAKRQMEEHASEHVGETLTSIREIWEDADPKMRMKLKEDFSKLIRDMNVE